MIKLQAKENFTLAEFKRLKNIIRATSYNLDGRLIKGDIFETDEELAKYLTNETPNPANRPVVEILEVKKKEVKEETKTDAKKETKKKTTLKKNEYGQK